MTGFGAGAEAGRGSGVATGDGAWAMGGRAGAVGEGASDGEC